MTSELMNWSLNCEDYEFMMVVNHGMQPYTWPEAPKVKRAVLNLPNGTVIWTSCGRGTAHVEYKGYWDNDRQEIYDDDGGRYGSISTFAASMRAEFNGNGLPVSINGWAVCYIKVAGEREPISKFRLPK